METMPLTPTASRHPPAASGSTEATTAPLKLYNFNQISRQNGAKAPTSTFETYLQETQASKETPTANVSPSVPRQVDPQTYTTPTDEEDFTFDDFIDIINPLHHIPVIGTIYRGLTGDEIKPAVRIVGDIAYGAMAGSVLLSAVTSITSLAIEQQTGEEPATLVAEALFGIDDEKQNDATPVETMLAITEPDGTNTPKIPQTTAQEDASGPPIQLASIESTAHDSLPKQAYGGVIAPPVSRLPPDTLGATTLAQNAQTGMMRVGDRLIPLSPVRSAHAQTKASPSTASTALAQAKMAAATIPASLPGTTSTKDGKSLGTLMKETSDLKTQGGSLPPDLVRDMMLMALDKYKMAGGLAPSEYKTGVIN